LHAKAHGRYPDAWDTQEASGEHPDGSALHPAVDELHLDPDSGTVTVRLNAAPFAGQHLVFKPRPARATVKVVRWDCGTTDIPVKRLPSDCALEWPSRPTPSTSAP